MNKISAVIITYNEAANLGRCLQSLVAVADELLVVDSFSTDGTVKIAESYGAKFVQHTFEGHIEQKNYAQSLAQHTWVLSLDADEALSDELAANIRAWKNWPNDNTNGYTFNRLNFYCGRAIKTCGWYPDKKIRLWKKGCGTWQGINPHDKLVLQTGNYAAHLNGDLLHYTHPTQASLQKQSEKFARIGAEHLRNKPLLFLLGKWVFSTPFRFLKSYFLQLGFTDGAAGLQISYYQTREVFYKYLWALQLKLTRA